MKKWIMLFSVCLLFNTGCRKEPSADEKRLDLALTALKNSFWPNGDTRYQINLITNEDASPGPYAIRLILPGKTLAQIAYETGDKSLLPYVKRNFVWGENESRYIQKGLCFNSDESGATAVMLMMEMFYEKASGDLEYAHLKKPILRCLRETYFNKDYGFREVLTKNEPHPFYDGEVWLALAFYADFFPEDVKTVDWIKAVDDILIRSYRKKTDEVWRFFHWGAQAAAQRYKTTKDPKFLDFLKYMFATIQRDMPVENIVGNMNSCTYSEGLADLIDVVEDPDIREAALERFARQVDGVRGLQILSTTLPDGSRMHPFAEPFVGLFYNIHGDYDVLPDTAQHCVAALSKAIRSKPYQQWLKKNRKSKVESVPVPQTDTAPEQVKAPVVDEEKPEEKDKK